MKSNSLSKFEEIRFGFFVDTAKSCKSFIYIVGY